MLGGQAVALHLAPFDLIPLANSGTDNLNPFRALRWRLFMFNGHKVSWRAVGGVVGLPQTPLALLLFLPGQFNDPYIKNTN